MNILQRKDFSPIYLAPGDALEMWYTDELGRKTLLAHEEVTESTTFDTLAVFELDKDALHELGWTHGLAGAYGKKDR